LLDACAEGPLDCHDASDWPPDIFGHPAPDER